MNSTTAAQNKDDNFHEKTRKEFFGEMPFPEVTISPPAFSNKSVSRSKPKEAKAKIAYAISITNCGDRHMIDGAAVLKHSIYLSSIHREESGSRYSYQMIAFVHPQADSCSSDDLRYLGYDVLIRDVPFNVTDIQGKYLREHIVKGGCCQEKEFLKLYAYTLLDYPVVVHIDVDTLLLRPMDELFDAIIDGPEEVEGFIPVMFDEDRPLPPVIDAFYTKDYNMLSRYGSTKHPGFQGGFFVVRPSRKAFDHYIQVILKEKFDDDYSGWGGLGYGGYYGARQIQGIMSYFYGHLHPGTAVELNRCIYNNIVDPPRAEPLPTEKLGQCKDTGTFQCEDCRETHPSIVKLVHFTLCQKPWQCVYHKKEEKSLCNSFTQSWFRIRKDMEESGLIAPIKRVENKSQLVPEIFLGYCTRGFGGYVPIQMLQNILL